MPAQGVPGAAEPFVTGHVPEPTAGFVIWYICGIVPVLPHGALHAAFGAFTLLYEQFEGGGAGMEVDTATLGAFAYDVERFMKSINTMRTSTRNIYSCLSFIFIYSYFYFPFVAVAHCTRPK